MSADVIPFPAARPDPQPSTWARLRCESESAAFDLVADLRAGPFPLPAVIMVRRPKWPTDGFVVEVR